MFFQVLEEGAKIRDIHNVVYHHQNYHELILDLFKEYHFVGH